jgi:hypothetical protein
VELRRQEVQIIIRFAGILSLDKSLCRIKAAFNVKAELQITGVLPKNRLRIIIEAGEYFV